MIIILIVVTIFGGLLNRLRGGWYDQFKCKAMRNTPHGAWRIIVAAFATICLHLPLFTLGIELNSLIWALFIFLSFFGLGLVQGWGSWFTIGRTEDSYNHNQDWILSEWLAFKKFGAKWVPWSKAGDYEVFARGDQALLERFNYVKSPTGKVRPSEWRRDMELFAMNIRGLNITLPASLLFGLELYFVYDIVALSLIPLAFSGYLFGHMYELGFKFNTSKLPRGFQGNTQLGEFISGATLMSGLLFLTTLFIIN